MRITEADLPKIHRIAVKAVNALLDSANRADHGLDEFFEDQLAFEIGYLLRSGENKKRHHSFIWFKYPYPVNKKRTDLLVCNYAMDHYIWIEIKFKKYGTSSDAGLSQLGWKKDFEKLRTPRKGQWGAEHHSYWIWLYVFPKEEIREKINGRNTWKHYKSPEQITNYFMSYNNRRKLGQTLQSIFKACKGKSHCSIKLNHIMNDTECTILVVTAQLK